MHTLEGDRYGLRAVIEDVKELQAQLPNLARQAAREAVSEYLSQKHAGFLADWKILAAVLSAGVGLGTLIAKLLLG